MEVIDIVAILGALAWLPHLFEITKKFFSKPEVRIIASRGVSLGFTTYGSIFNLHLAFSTKNKDVVVTGIKITLRHSSGEKKNFEWQGIQQEVMKMTAPDGSILPYQKETSVLAMKINEQGIEERFIQFQESAYHSSKEEKEREIIEEIVYLRSQGEFDPAAFMNSEKMQALFKYIKQSFSWKAGVYDVIIELESPNDFNLVGSKYSFTLTPIDVEELEKNKNCIEHYYKNQIVPQSDEEYENVNWYWKNPILTKGDE